MRRLKPILTFKVLWLLVLFSSCNDNTNDPAPIPPKTGVIIVNEGNFGAGNGSISLYDEVLKTITNNVVKTANGGSEIGSLVQSIYLNDGVGYIICNSPDKVEFINESDFKFVDNPITNISQPRYMTAAGDKGYISCWGQWDLASWTLPNSYIAVIDLSSRKIVDTLQCGSGPEGIITFNNKLYVANTQEESISVIDLASKSSLKVTLESTASHLVADANGMIWVSTKSGLQSINSTSLEPVDKIDIDDLNGKMTINSSGTSIYYLTTKPWPETGSSVFVFKTDVKIKETSALFSGENFYGIAYNFTTDRLYVSDSKAFSGPGEIIVYDLNGKLLDSQVSSVGPNGFVFK